MRKTWKKYSGRPSFQELSQKKTRKREGRKKTLRCHKKRDEEGREIQNVKCLAEGLPRGTHVVGSGDRGVDWEHGPKPTEVINKWTY